MSQLGKKLAEYNRRVRDVKFAEKKKKGGSKQSKDLKEPGPKGANHGVAGSQPEPKAFG